MLKNPLLAYTMIAESVLCCALIIVCWRKKLFRAYGLVAALTALWGTEVTLSLAILFFRREVGLSLPVAYKTYVYSYWVSNALAYALTLCVIYQVFRKSMTPFRGLRRLGTMIFRWVCGVSVVITLGITLVPMHGGYLTVLVQLGQSISILTICLLLFVCFSAHYLGMTYRTRLFGLSLGLGVQGLTNLLMSAWTSVHGVQSLYSSVYLIPAFGAIGTVAIWGTYFLLPEPEAKMVLLPTTSPYFHWNQVSEALGDHPGMVAVSGFTPDMLAPAERTMLGATAKRLRERADTLTKVDVTAQDHAVAMPR